MQEFNENDPHSSWMFNVRDNFKPLSQDDIRTHLRETANPFAIMMSHVNGDFNISSMIRSANSFNAKEVFYFGKKRFDKRGTCGVHHYTPITFLSSIEEIMALKDRYTFVALENNIKYPIHNLMTFSWKTDKTPLVICGEEGFGIREDVLDICDYYVEIPSYGSVRSLNCASATTIAMYDLLSKIERK